MHRMIMKRKYEYLVTIFPLDDLYKQKLQQFFF